MARTKQVRGGSSSRPPKPEAGANEDASEAWGRRGDGGASRMDGVTSRRQPNVKAESNQVNDPAPVTVAVKTDSVPPSFPNQPSSHAGASNQSVPSQYRNNEINFQSSSVNGVSRTNAPSGSNPHGSNSAPYDSNRFNSRDNQRDTGRSRNRSDNRGQLNTYNSSHHHDNRHHPYQRGSDYRYDSRPHRQESSRRGNEYGGASHYQSRNHHDNSRYYNHHHNGRGDRRHDGYDQDRNEYGGANHYQSRNHHDGRSSRHEYDHRRNYGREDGHRDGYDQVRDYHSRRPDHTPSRHHQDPRSKRPKHDSAHNQEPALHNARFERDMARLKTEQKEAEVKETDLELERIDKKIKIEEKKRELEAKRMSQEAAVAAARGSVDTGKEIRSFAAAAGNNDSAAAGKGDADDEELFSNAAEERAIANPCIEPQADDLVDSDDELESGNRSSGRIGTKKKAKAKKATKETKAKKPKKVVKATKKKKAVDNPAEESAVNLPYTEKSLMTKYTPEIVDHSFVTNKFLVQWNKSNGSLSESPCRSWVGFETFVFPKLAKSYISKLIKSGKDSSDLEVLRRWKSKFPLIEKEVRESNSIQEFNEGEGEGLDLAEIDFCCFLCQCKDSLKSNCLKNCEYGRKFHRPCCHGHHDVEDWEGLELVSAAGKTQMDFLMQVKQDDVSEEQIQNDVDETKFSAVKVCNGENSLNVLKGSKGKAVVLSINTGIGGVAVAVKQLGLDTKRIIHVEGDPVAQHAIRYHHDWRYGETDVDDGIDHVVGLYNSFEEVCADPFDLVTRFGPIDLIVCTSSGKNEDEHKKFAENFFNFCDNVKISNRDIKGHESLLYLLDTHPSVGNEASDSRCQYDTNHAFICNWPLEASSLKRLGLSLSNLNASIEQKLGFPDEYTMSSVSSLFKVLKAALTVGFSCLMWSCEVHPKFWNFLTLSPKGHNFKVDPKSNPNDSCTDAMMLEIKEPECSKFLCDADYANLLLRRSLSIHWLVEMLKPVSGGFQKKQYRVMGSLAEMIENISQNQDDEEEEDQQSPNQYQAGENQESTKGASAAVGDYEASTDEEPLEGLLGGNKPLAFDL